MLPNSWNSFMCYLFIREYITYFCLRFQCKYCDAVWFAEINPSVLNFKWVISSVVVILCLHYSMFKTLLSVSKEMVLKCKTKFEILNLINNNYNRMLKATLTNWSKFLASYFKIPSLYILYTIYSEFFAAQ